MFIVHLTSTAAMFIQYVFIKVPGHSQLIVVLVPCQSVIRILTKDICAEWLPDFFLMEASKTT